MKARGYPVSHFDQRAADISVDHARVVENYRSVHEVALRIEKATTEDLRTAMIHHRSYLTNWCRYQRMGSMAISMKSSLIPPSPFSVAVKRQIF